MQTLNEADELAAMGNGLHAWHKEEFAAENAAIAAVPTIEDMVKGGLEALTKATAGNSLAIKVAWVHNARAITAGRELCKSDQAYGQWVREAFGPEAKTQWATRMRKTYERFYGTPLERLSYTALILMLPQTEEVGIVIEQATVEVLKGNCPTVKWLQGKLGEATQAEIARKKAMKNGGNVAAAMSKLTDIVNGKVEAFVGPIQPIDNERVTIADAQQAQVEDNVVPCQALMKRELPREILQYAEVLEQISGTMFKVKSIVVQYPELASAAEMVVEYMQIFEYHLDKYAVVQDEKVVKEA